MVRSRMGALLRAVETRRPVLPSWRPGETFYANGDGSLSADVPAAAAEHKGQLLRPGERGNQRGKTMSNPRMSCPECKSEHIHLRKLGGYRCRSCMIIFGSGPREARAGVSCAALVGVEPPTPHTCPPCNGHGTVSRPPWIAGDQESWTASSTNPYPCRACGGTGIVWYRADTPTDQGGLPRSG